MLLHRYYLSGSDAFRLKLMLPLHPVRLQHIRDEQLAAEQLRQLSLVPGEIKAGSSKDELLLASDSQKP